MPDSVSGQRHGRTALILYGTETGNSQDVAEELGRMAERLRFMTRVREMDAVEIKSLLEYSIVIFVISTTGQGEFPKNSCKFWKSLLRKRLPPGCLNHVSFTSFGLGDSSYSKFNWAARKLHKRVEQLGGREIYPRGEADEQHDEGIDGTFLSWSIDLRKHLLSSFPLPEGVDPIPQNVLLPPKFTLKLLEPEDYDHKNSESIQKTSLRRTQPITEPPETSKSYLDDSTMFYIPPPEPHESSTGLQLKNHFAGEDEASQNSIISPSGDSLPIPKGFRIRLVENKRVTPLDHWQDVRLLTFHMESEIAYYPGDAITIYPKNFVGDVNRLIVLMGWESVADEPLRFEPVAPDYLIDPYFATVVPGLYPMENTTLRQLLTHNLDITAIPRPFFFQCIAHYAEDPVQKERLLEFGNSTYRDEYYDYATRPRRSILEILADFDSLKLPFNDVTSIFPIIRGRQYSICSGGLGKQVVRSHTQSDEDSDQFVKVQILVAIVKYQTVLKKVRQGLCSRYLASLKPGDYIKISISRSESFYKIPRLFPQSPVIMIAAGTGVAPCRSLIWERARLAANHDIHSDELPVGPNILIYGGRNKQADFFFEEEFTSPALRTEVITAFSRDQKEKIYVQDIIRREGKKLVDLINQGSVVYVCGSAGKMPIAVRAAFVRALMEFGIIEMQGNLDETERFMTSIEKNGNYVQETW